MDWPPPSGGGFLNRLMTDININITKPNPESNETIQRDYYQINIETKYDIDPDRLAKIMLFYIDYFEGRTNVIEPLNLTK